jgi:acetyl-CoA carboxylase biotin carboxyl carrier protein
MASLAVKSEIAGNVWKIEAQIGDKLDFEGTILILESMKMEIPVLAPKAGTLREIKVAEGEAVAEGQVVALLDT